MPPDRHCYGDLIEAFAADSGRSSLRIGFPVRKITQKDIELGDVVICVFGATGSGKSTFINALADNSSRLPFVVGNPNRDTLIDCAQISVLSVPTRVVLVEVPGFGDERKSDAKTLGLFFRWLENLYSQGKQISGVLFLDPITAVDTGQAPMSRSLEMLQKLYGHLQRDRIVLVTSKWNQIPMTQRGRAQQLERMLFAKAWSSFLDGDNPSLTARFDSGSKQSALHHATEILVMLIGHIRDTQGVRLLIQRQKIDEGLPLYWTDAGKLAFTMAEVQNYQESVFKPALLHSTAATAAAGLTSVDVTLKDIVDDDIIIGVFGETGAGKSTFALALSHGAKSSITVGHNTPGTSQVTCVRVWMPEMESNVVIVDTPGFNNPLVSDAETLDVVATWLVDLYRSGRQLHGALYLHRITDIRIDSGAQRSLSIFLSLYGRSHYDQLTLVTTMWDNVPRSELSGAEQRERELLSSSGYCLIAGSKGEPAQRFNASTPERAYLDARDIVVNLTRTVSNPIKLRIQEQMVDRNMPVQDTDAGLLAFEPEIETDDDQGPTLPFDMDSDSDISDEEETTPPTVEIHDAPARPAAEKVTLGTLTEKDVIIGVFGATGVGKTTFIDALADSRATWLTIGHSLEAGTRNIGCVRVHIPEMQICAVLVDTPGFDDEHRTDGEILRVIATWLQALHTAGQFLSGAIYIHPITDVRINSGTQRAMSIFREMFGDEQNDRITLVTSKWNDIHKNNIVQLRVAESREKDLLTDAWAIFLGNSTPANTARFDYDSEKENTANASAMKVLLALLKVVEKRGGLRLSIQKQMMDERLSLEMTDAGRLAFEEPQDEKNIVEEIDLEDIEADDVVICILGETGAGKTKFITALAGEDAPGLFVGHDLDSATDRVVCVRFTIPHLNEDIVLVDTPGFNQSNRSDGQILIIVATWLAQSYTLGVKLDGVLYLQNIDSPVNNTGSKRALSIFQKMYGKMHGYEQVTFVTTMWSEISKDDLTACKAAEERQMALANTAWAPYLKGQRKATIQRFDSTTTQSAYDHALKIISPVIKERGNRPRVTMHIQEEMVTNRNPLSKTDAGKFTFTSDELKQLRKQGR